VIDDLLDEPGNEVHTNPTRKRGCHVIPSLALQVSVGSGSEQYETGVIKDGFF
jgi:hypothetical protein